MQAAGCATEPRFSCSAEVASPSRSPSPFGRKQYCPSSLSFISLPPPPFFSGSKNDTTNPVTPGLPCPSGCQAPSILSPQCMFTGPGLDYLFTLQVPIWSFCGLFLPKSIYTQPATTPLLRNPQWLSVAHNTRSKHGSGLEAFHDSTQFNQP